MCHQCFLLQSPKTLLVRISDALNQFDTLIDLPGPLVHRILAVQHNVPQCIQRPLQPIQVVDRSFEILIPGLILLSCGRDAVIATQNAEQRIIHKLQDLV